MKYYVRLGGSVRGYPHGRRLGDDLRPNKKFMSPSRRLMLMMLPRVSYDILDKGVPRTKPSQVHDPSKV